VLLWRSYANRYAPWVRARISAADLRSA
jgi:hypothetical protein